MKGRERINLAINHKEADRVPIDLGATRSSSISTIAYNNLLKTLRLEAEPSRMYDFIQQLAYPGREIRDRFHVDTIDSGQAFLKNKDEWREWFLNDGSTCLIPKYLNIEVDREGKVLLKDRNDVILGQKPKSSLYTDHAYYVYGDLKSIPETFVDEDLSKQMWAIPSPPHHLNITNREDRDLFGRVIKNLYENTDSAVVTKIGCVGLESGSFLRKYDKFLLDIYTDRKGAERLLDRQLDMLMVKLEKILSCIGNHTDILGFADDLGTQNGLWMSPDVTREVLIPRYKKLWSYVHDHSNCKVFFHSCGSLI
ncbi:MAG: hypothetical protein HOC09_29130 [Deltaproteobacteria bacterium]|jgi:uroporphyrinogen decarboxylase|nr:hypothetical protein [Deltaproteobacteria bacterium]